MVIMPLRHLLVLTIISLFIGLSGIGFLGAPDVRFVLLGIVMAVFGFWLFFVCCRWIGRFIRGFFS